MLHKTKGVVLKTTEYSESSVVVQIFTEKFGMQSYIINGVKKAKSRIKMNMLQPLHLVDMVVYQKPGADIQKVSELRNDPVFETIPYDMVKSCLAMFLNEVVYKSIRGNSADQPLFFFLHNTIPMLDHAQKGVANYHIWFLLKLSRYLGFYPEQSKVQSRFFDLQSGSFTDTMPLHPHALEGQLKELFSKFLAASIEDLSLIVMPGPLRRELLRAILDYYRFHLDSLGEIHSHLILEEVLS